MPNEEWRESAQCMGEDTEVFFPPRDKAKYKDIATIARAHCLGDNGSPACPVRLQCLWYAIDSDEVHGIWGGMSHRERNALVRKWQKTYRSQMTLEEYVFQLKEGKSGRT